jgi:hypothetical protein
MPQSGAGLWAVGYARGYNTLEAGLAAAKRDAYARLRRDRRRILEGEKLYEGAPGFQTSFEGANFTNTGLPDTLRSVAYVDSLRVAGMTLVLAAWAPSRAPPDRPSGRRAPFADAPPWIQNGVNGDSARARAVGRASRYYYLEHSWRRAETRARRRLAFQAGAKIERLKKSTEDWRHDVTSVQTRARLRNVQTLARWADGETCYVLVEGTVDEVLIE